MAEPASAPESAARPSFIDIHCHCLPGLDDGPQNMKQSLALCRVLAADGVSVVVATPHQLGLFEGSYASADIRQGVSLLNTELSRQKIPLEVLPGADVRVDERIPALLHTGQILTVADQGRYLLLELPHDVLIPLENLLTDLAAESITVILTHPERHEYLMQHPHTVKPWLEKGLLLQITADSLLGNWGPRAEAAAWHFLETNPAALVASDAHHSKLRPSRLTDAWRVIARRLGEPAARQHCVENPRRILAPVPESMHQKNQQKVEVLHGQTH